MNETRSIINSRCTWESNKILKLGKKDKLNNNSNNKSEYHTREIDILINNG